VSDERPLPELGVAEMEAVARLWRATRREVVCRFGGTSMVPSVPPQAEVRLCCGEQGGLGSVIAFLEGGRVIVHRVVALSARAGWILTRGDGRLLPDAPIRDLQDVIGRVAGVRAGASFVDPAPPPHSAAQWLVLWPVVLALRAHPGGGAALLRALLRARRAALRVMAAVRRKLSAVPR